MNRRPLPAQLEQLVLQLEQDNTQTICLIGDQGKTGVTHFATALAEHYLLAGYRTLLLDLNLDNPAFECPLQSEQNQGEWIAHQHTRQLFAGLVAPTTQSQLRLYQEPRALAQQMQLWQQDYERIVIDAGSLHNSQTQSNNTAIVNACDATLLTCSGGVTTQEELCVALEYLQQAKANVCGVIVNQYFQQTFAFQLLTAIKYCRFLPQRLQQWLHKVINRAQLFKQTV
ncbi:hypothetical protein [Vibrio rarus]|uniref:hypothetical protein n=1 Tax=Vibrio rarus TaxID=413403 RepID=UPI0021C26B3C|nr:hypothetical protein [Vibrio rarus]